MNPLLPAEYDIAWTVVLVLGLSVVVAAFVSLALSAPRMSPLAAVLWVAMVLLVPVVGAVAWLAVGRRTVPRRPRDSTA